MDFTDQFLDTWAEGYQCYIRGNWPEATAILARTRDMLGREDGPSRTLLDYMAHNRAVHWKGFRKLASK